MRLAIAYGTGFFPVTVNEPLRVQLVAPVSVPPPLNPDELICNSVSASKQFIEMAKTMTKNSRFAVVMDSPERSEFSTQMLIAVLSNLTSIAVHPSQVSIIVSSEVYASPDLRCVDEVLGHPTENGYTIILHDSSDKTMLRDIGKTSHSVQVDLNSYYVDADYRIITSTVVQDVFKSATGGCASILPGLSCAKTIARNRKLMAVNKSGSFFLESVAYNNIVEASQMCAPDLTVNLVPDWKDSIAQVVVGDMVSTWQSSIETAKKIASFESTQKVDLAIVSAGGEIHDSTLYNALTALVSGHSITRQGGTILLIAECPNGPGSVGFVEGIATSQSERDVLLRAETEFKPGMEGSRLFWKILDSRNVIICSRMKSSMVTEKLHCLPVQDPADGLEIAINNHGTTCNVALLPNGSRTIFSP